ncbi:MAG: hypothetical protein IJ883_06100 [Eubacterium sp.]|nr:hypothetical protein [Eubacterium sp.]
MNFIAEYWYLIVVAVAIVAVAIYMVCKFFKLPRSSQIAKVKEWLLFAVTEAERELGSGTGQLKLRYVYDMFVTKFPYLVQFVSFEFFSNIVDEVLVKFKDMFKTNVAVKQYVDSNTEVEHKNEV